MELRKAAEEYKSPETLNVAALEKVPVDTEIKEFEGTNDKGESFSYMYVEIDEQPYRVPKSVLKQLKGLLEEKPQMTHFKVKKTGEGMNTEYQVLEA